MRHTARWLRATLASGTLLLGACEAAPDVPTVPPIDFIGTPAAPPEAIDAKWEQLLAPDVLAGQLWPLFGGGFGSPDGRWVARVERGQIEVFNTSGTRQASSPMPPDLGEAEVTAWAPDGKQFVVQVRAARGGGPLPNPDVIVVDWDASKKTLALNVIPVRDLPERPVRVFLSFGASDRLMIFARTAFRPPNARDGVNTPLYYGEVRVYDTLKQQRVLTDTAEQGGALILGETVVGIRVTDSERNVFVADKSGRTRVPLPSTPELIVFGGDMSGDWLLVTGLEKPGTRKILTAVNRRTGQRVALAQIVSASRAVTGTDGAYTAVEVISADYDTRLFLIDWRHASRPVSRDAGPISRLSGFDATSGRFVAIVKDDTGELALAALSPQP
jgi:hypothetical protein